jgi:hypothetical protein
MHVLGKDASKMRLAEHDDVVETSLRMEPMIRSTKGFCQVIAAPRPPLRCPSL